MYLVTSFHRATEEMYEQIFIPTKSKADHYARLIRRAYAFLTVDVTEDNSLEIEAAQLDAEYDNLHKAV